MGGALLQDVIQLGQGVGWNHYGLTWFTDASILCFKMFYKQSISLFKFLLLLISLPNKNKCYNFSFISIISPPYFNRCNFSWKFLQILLSELGGGSCIHPRSTYLNLSNASFAINLGPTHPYEQGWKTSGPFPSVKHLYTVGSGHGRRSSSSSELRLVLVFGCIPPPTTTLHPPTHQD